MDVGEFWEVKQRLGGGWGGEDVDSTILANK